MENAGIFYGRLEYCTVIWYILWPFGIFYGHLVYFMAIWNILRSFGIFSLVLVYCVKKNLATPYVDYQKPFPRQLMTMKTSQLWSC
jgi:hypothetical protein